MDDDKIQRMDYDKSYAKDAGYARLCLYKRAPFPLAFSGQENAFG